MKRISAILLICIMALSLFACKKAAEDTTQKLQSPVTEEDMFCVCAEYDSDAEIVTGLTQAGFEASALAIGSMHENSNNLFHTDDSDMFVYEFDDAFLAGKAYNAILTGECDGAYPTNFMGLSGSLIRVGRFVIDDNLSSTGTGKTLRKVYELAGIDVPKAQQQEGFENRVAKSYSGIKKKALLKEYKDNSYTLVKLAVSFHGASESYLLLEDNGIVAGRLDMSPLEGAEAEAYYSAVSEAYNKRIGFAYTNSGFVVVTWYKDCMDVLINAEPQNTPAPETKSDTTKSGD